MLRQSAQRERGSDRPGSAPPVADMDGWDRLVSGWLWVEMLLLCLFRKQPHHSSKPGLKHRSFDELTTTRLHVAIGPLSYVHKHDGPGRNAFVRAASFPVVAGTCCAAHGSDPDCGVLLCIFYSPCDMSLLFRITLYWVFEWVREGNTLAATVERRE